MKKIFLLVGIFALMSMLTLNAQVTIGKNVPPDSSAVLDLQSNGNLGMLLPRVVLTDTLSPSPLKANVPGMMVYNTNTSADGKVVAGVYINDGQRWWLANGGAEGPWDIAGTTTAAKLNTQDIYQMGGVAIGVDTLQKVTVLNVVSDNRGIMIPRMTKDQRDAIDTINANSLMVYNTDEDCYNYYSKSAGQWQSLCGGIQKAMFTMASCDSIVVNGSYIQGSPLNGSNYLSIPVNVTKSGNYTISAMTQNGYGFTGSGTILDDSGTVVLMIPGQGTPKYANQSPGDLVSFTSSGGDINCTDLHIPVVPALADYTVTCGSAKVFGTYTVEPDKTNSDDQTHYITVNVNVNSLSTAGAATTGWAAQTNSVSGEQFQGNGNFSSTGPNTITLYALPGTKPTSLDPIVLTMTFQTINGPIDCQVTLQAAYPSKKIVAFGNAGGVYGYVGESGDSKGFISSSANFGSLSTSTVKMVDQFTPPAGYTKYGAFSYRFVPGGGGAVNDQANWTQIMQEKPDIVFITYDAPDISATTAGYIMQYVNAGGIVFQFAEASVTQIVSAVTGLPAAQYTTGAYGNGLWTMLANFPDPILNGPFQPVINGVQTKTLGGLELFGDAGNQMWGVIGVQGSSSITVYGYNNASTAPGIGSASAFKIGTNYIYIGEGGFLCNPNGGTPADNIEPFITTGPPDYKPAPRVVSAGGDGNYKNQQTAPYPSGYNSFFFGNMLAWAVQQSGINGINAGQ